MERNDIDTRLLGHPEDLEWMLALYNNIDEINVLPVSRLYPNRDDPNLRRIYMRLVLAGNPGGQHILFHLKETNP